MTTHNEEQYTLRCLIGGCTLLSICLLIVYITAYKLQLNSTGRTQSVIATTPERIKLQRHKTYTLVDENDQELTKINVGGDPE